MYVLGVVERGRRAAAVRGKMWAVTQGGLGMMGRAFSFGTSLKESMKRTMQSSMGGGVLRYLMLAL
jgi:hypothetical protein